MQVCKMAEVLAQHLHLLVRLMNKKLVDLSKMLTFYLERVCLTTRIIGTFLGIIGMFLSIIGRFLGNWGIA